VPDLQISDPTIAEDGSQNASSGDAFPRQRRFLALGLVLSISFVHFIASSLYYLLGGAAPNRADQHTFRLIGGLISEITALLLLWYILSEQKRSWRDIGWNPGWKDIPRGIGLLVLGLVAATFTSIVFELFYGLSTGHYLQKRSIDALFGFGISALSVAFVILNPFFEELIVRAYTMSEILELGGSRTLAIILSVALQMSYHLYQGLLSGLALTGIFTVFSIYFSRTRRIAPIILAHFCFDAYALFRGHF